MSPDAVFGLLHLADRWRVMLLNLQHQPMPEPPPLPGRVFVAPVPPTVEQDREQRDAEQAAAKVWQQLAEGEGSGDHD